MGKEGASAVFDGLTTHKGDPQYCNELGGRTFMLKLRSTFLAKVRHSLSAEAPIVYKEKFQQQPREEPAVVEMFRSRYVELSVTAKPSKEKEKEKEQEGEEHEESELPDGLLLWMRAKESGSIPKICSQHGVDLQKVINHMPRVVEKVLDSFAEEDFNLLSTQIAVLKEAEGTGKLYVDPLEPEPAKTYSLEEMLKHVKISSQHMSPSATCSEKPLPEELPTEKKNLQLFAGAVRFPFFRSRFLLFTGETGTGKSTIINSLCGKVIFPMGPNSCTQTLCELHCADECSVTAYYLSGKVEHVKLRDGDEPIVILRKWFSLKTTQPFRVEVHWPVPALPRGYVLVDTPGFCSGWWFKPQHWQHFINDYLRRVTALVFIFDDRPPKERPRGYENLMEFLAVKLTSNTGRPAPVILVANAYLGNTWAVEQFLDPCVPKLWQPADTGPRRVLLNAGQDLEMLIAFNFDLQALTKNKGRSYGTTNLKEIIAAVLRDDKLRDIYCTVWSCIAKFAFSTIIAFVVKCFTERTILKGFSNIRDLVFVPAFYLLWKLLPGICEVIMMRLLALFAPFIRPVLYLRWRNQLLSLIPCATAALAGISILVLPKERRFIVALTVFLRAIPEFVRDLLPQSVLSLGKYLPVPLIATACGQLTYAYLVAPETLDQRFHRAWLWAGDPTGGLDAELIDAIATRYNEGHYKTDVLVRRGLADIIDTDNWCLAKHPDDPSCPAHFFKFTANMIRSSFPWYCGLYLLSGCVALLRRRVWSSPRDDHSGSLQLLRAILIRAFENVAQSAVILSLWTGASWGVGCLLVRRGLVSQQKLPRWLLRICVGVPGLLSWFEAPHRAYELSYLFLGHALVSGFREALGTSNKRISNKESVLAVLLFCVASAFLGFYSHSRTGWSAICQNKTLHAMIRFATGEGLTGSGSAQYQSRGLIAFFELGMLQFLPSTKIFLDLCDMITTEDRNLSVSLRWLPISLPLWFACWVIGNRNQLPQLLRLTI